MPTPSSIVIASSYMEPPLPPPSAPKEPLPLIEEQENGVVLRTGTITKTMAAFWSKSSCRRCNGTGVLRYDSPGGAERIEACPCVLRNMSQQRRI